LITLNGENYIQTERDQSGFAIYGDNEEYEPGEYSVAFEVTVSEEWASENFLCGWAEVTASLGTVPIFSLSAYYKMTGGWFSAFRWKGRQSWSFVSSASARYLFELPLKEWFIRIQPKATNQC
jgi:hypothetical protein